MDNNLTEEANAFNRQIEERVKNGHIPDLRRSGRCEYFYNNVWRDQYFANLYFGQLVDRIVIDIKTHLNRKLNDVSLLEVGCGPGHISLELARNGVNVTGLDISKACIDVATKTAETDPYIESRGKLGYSCSNFFELKQKFDVIIFVAALHHFPNCDEIISHAKGMLNENGLILVDEPIRDHVDKRNAAIIYLIRSLLSATGSYYKATEIRKNIKECVDDIESVYMEEKYELEGGLKAQSINDNEAGYDDMYGALTRNFKELFSEKKYAFYHQLVGGVRLKNHEDEYKLASFMKIMDGLLCDYKVLNPTNFYFLGKKE